MRTRVQKWGTSLVVRIPKTFAQEAGLSENSPVDLSLVQGQLVLRPVKARAPTLEKLLRGVTPENSPGEWDTGPPTGMEIR
jgi:antitoxin MazE